MNKVSSAIHSFKFRKFPELNRALVSVNWDGGRRRAGQQDLPLFILHRLSFQRQAAFSASAHLFVHSPGRSLLHVNDSCFKTAPLLLCSRLRAFRLQKGSVMLSILPTRCCCLYFRPWRLLWWDLKLDSCFSSAGCHSSGAECLNHFYGPCACKWITANGGNNINFQGNFLYLYLREARVYTLQL